MMKIKISNKKAIMIILGMIFIFMFILNLLTPMIADDYSYALGVEHQKISSINDIVKYQINHYLKWGGRTVAHSIAQFFMIFPKYIFDLFNSIVYTAVVYLIYKFGKNNSKEDKTYLLVLIHLMLYFLTPVFGQNCIWFVGSCNYIWTMLIMLSIVYQYRYNYESKDSILRIILLFILGILAGWTNENTSFGAITIVTSLIILNWKDKKKLKKWHISGLLGQVVGFAIMILAPGNFVRSSSFDNSDFIIIRWFKRFVECTQGIYEYCLPLIILLIVLLTIYIYNKKKFNKTFYVYIIGAFFSIYPMVLSPEFPARSWFGVIVFLVIAIMILIYDLDKIKKIFKYIIYDIIIIYGIIYVNDYMILAKDIYQLRIVWTERIELINKSKGKEPITLYGYESYNKKSPAYQLADIGYEKDGWPNQDIGYYYSVEKRGIVRYKGE